MRYTFIEKSLKLLEHAEEIIIPLIEIKQSEKKTKPQNKRKQKERRKKKGEVIEKQKLVFDSDQPLYARKISSNAYNKHPTDSV